MIVIYFDEDSGHHGLVAAVRRAGMTCWTTAEKRMRGHSDEDQLGFAATESIVLFSANVGHFVRLDNQWRAEGRIHAGIIVLTAQRAPVGVQLRALQKLAASVSAEEMRGRLEFLLNWA
ncbi:MAG: hypothetical protein C0506_01265 [Anaerolinea sp.]|nr:hypothetical protein [Anaerolinea sp.]